MRTTMRIAGTLVAVALMATPAVAQNSGQGSLGAPLGAPMGRGMAQGGPAQMQRNPATRVLEHRDALELTAAQVARLEAIEARVTAENGPRWERMKAAFGGADPREMTVEQRQALRERMQELEGERAAIRAINRSAGQEIHQLLTDEQVDRLRPIMHEGRGMRGDGSAQGRRGPRGQRGHRGGGGGGGGAGGPAAG